MAYRFIQARNYTKGRIKKVRGIVIHDMEAPEASGTAENVAAWFGGSTAPQASTHYNVDNNSVVQSVKESDTAWHCPGFNADGIGIEHAGYAKQSRTDWTDTFSRAELAVSAKLSAQICKRYGIPVRRLTAAQIRDGKSKGFVGHVDVTRALGTAGGHVDPGPNFPWDVYLKMVQAELDALNGNPWTSAKVKAAAAAVGLAVAVFSGITVTSNPTPTPAPKPSVVKVVPAPKPTQKPAPKPPTKCTCPAPVKTLGAFPLARGQWYGAKTHLSANHSGYYAKDRTAIVKIQRAVGAVADGHFGPATEAKVKAKQRALHLTADGLVGPSTWSRLRLP